MSGDGNGWLECRCGHRHWGVHGAAGLLVVAEDSVLLQFRSAWTHQGGTWAVPGGARDSHEDPLTAALREAEEETDLRRAHIEPVAEYVDDHGPWSYTTVIARAVVAAPVRSTNPESDQVSWWAIPDVAALPLHPGFAAAWPALQDLIVAHRSRL